MIQCVRECPVIPPGHKNGAALPRQRSLRTLKTLYISEVIRGEVPSRDGNSYIDSKGLVKKLQYKCFMDILGLLKGCSKCVLRFSERCLKGCSKSVKWKFHLKLKFEV